ncbi:magnesium transporter [Trichlorobacter lovleyi]|uniref:magnesium transporter n=1 Tax=Trichlorobacter lovleyi TaxID=313985 RepID=UPI0022407E29|nr:CBS domain-containing protein [Trichlorobacter lovleyi]
MTMRTEYSEIYLSSVIGRSIITSSGQEVGTLRDLIMVPGEVFPEVSHLVIRRGRNLELLPWGMVKLFTHIVISTTGTIPTGLTSYIPAEGEILVRHDLLDKQIVDVDGAKVVRVNDVKLGNLHDKLCIFSVDIGFRGILRRLGYERLGERVARTLRKDIPTTEISWEYVQPIEANSSKLALNIARNQMNEIHPADLADILESIPIQNIKTVLETIDAETTGETLYELEPDMRNLVINQMDSEQASDILEEMEPDEAADVLADLPEQKAQELLELMDEENAEEIQELLEHEDDTAGGLMNSDYFRLSPNETVGSALTALRLAYEELNEIHYGYVVNEENRPEGAVSIRQLLTHPPEVALSELMDEDLVTVEVSEELTETLELMTKYDLLALPVLDTDGTMAGVLTVDDLLQHLLPKLIKSRRGGMM